MKNPTRRGLLKNAAVAAAGVTGVAAVSTTEAQAQTGVVWQKKIVRRAPNRAPAAENQTGAPATPAAPAKPPLFNGIVTFGNLVFIASRAPSRSTRSMCSMRSRQI